MERDGYLENPEYLRSSPARTHSFARFYNNTKHPATLIWINYKGKGVIYKSNLEPQKWLDVDTFAGHKWVFVRSGTNERLLADKRCVWIGAPWTNHCTADNKARRRLVILGLPLYSLKEICFNAVNRKLTEAGCSADNIATLPHHLVEEIQQPFYRHLMPFKSRPQREERDRRVGD